jgi:hypothetical protein
MNSSIRSRVLCAAVVAAISLAPLQVFAQFDLSPFLPSGVSMNNATPQQINQAVLAAAQQNPDAAAEIASGSFQSVFDVGRYTLPGSQVGKQDADPDGGSSDPTLEEWAQSISDAAKQGNPALAPQIDSAVASALTAAQQAVASSTAGSTSGGGSTGTTPPPMIPPGGGGGTSTASTGASN